jgi:flagellar hook-associated protein 1 FlgK
VVDAAQALASDFRVSRAQLVDMQVPVVNLADDTIREINRMSEQIAGLNNGIRRQETSEREASDLRDARDRLLDELAQKAGTRVVEHKDGTVTVSLLSGPALVTSDQFNQLGSQVVAGTLRLTLSDDDGSPTLLLNENSTGGELEGVLTSYNTDLGGAIQSLDELAFGLVRGMNALHTTGFGLDGNNGRDFFNITGPVNGAAASIELNPVIDADPNLIAATVNAGALPGGSDLAVELGNLRKVGLADLGGASVEEFLSEFQVDIGDKIRGTEQGLMDSESQDLTFSSIRESTRGVNLDEELTDLISFQRGFQAAGRVVQAADEMMETVLSLI